MGPGWSQRDTTPHTHTHTGCSSFGLGCEPLTQVFWNQIFGTPLLTVKGGWLLLVDHFLDVCRHTF